MRGCLDPLAPHAYIKAPLNVCFSYEFLFLGSVELSLCTIHVRNQNGSLVLADSCTEKFCTRESNFQRLDGKTLESQVSSTGHSLVSMHCFCSVDLCWLGQRSCLVCVFLGFQCGRLFQLVSNQLPRLCMTDTEASTVLMHSTVVCAVP